VRAEDPAAGRGVVGPAGHDLLAWQQGKIGDPSRIDALAAGLVRVATLLGH